MKLCRRLGQFGNPRLRISGDVQPRENPRDGSGDPPTDPAEVIDLDPATPSWGFVGSMAFARRQINATLLPDGTVLRSRWRPLGPGFNDPAGAVRAAELWDPANPMQWTTLASGGPGIAPRLPFYCTAAARWPGLEHGRQSVFTLPLQTGLFTHRRISFYVGTFSGAHDGVPVPASVAYGQSFFVQTPRRRSNFKGHDAETLLGDPFNISRH